jgi:hypothetical protein
MWATSVIYKKKQVKVSNHPMGENLLNLVTLFARWNWLLDKILMTSLCTMKTLRE